MPLSRFLFLPLIFLYEFLGPRDTRLSTKLRKSTRLSVSFQSYDLEQADQERVEAQEPNRTIILLALGEN